MPTESPRIAATETSTSALIDRLDAGERVVLELKKLGITTTVTLRKQGETYYCETPIKLLTYDTREGMKTCLERLGVDEP